MNLMNIPVNSNAIIQEIYDCEYKNRLLELGFVFGEEVKIISKGDPIIAELFGRKFGLRKDIAENIIVYEGKKKE